MTLHEAIEKVLKENNRPMMSSAIVDVINKNNYYTRADREPIQSNQVLARIKNYPSLFQNINGYIVLVEDKNWKNILTSYWYLVNILKGVYIIADTQFIIAVILFYKRLVDINDRPGRRYPLDFNDKYEHSFDKMFNYGRSFIEGIKSLEVFHIAPAGIFEECSRLLSKLDKYKNEEIWAIVRNIQTKELGDIEFGNIYEYFITLDSLDTYRSTINHTPFSLKELMIKLLDPKPGKSIYNPVAGTGGLLIEALLYENTDKANSKGSEINNRIAQLGNMNLMMHGIYHSKIVAKDCFEEINENKEFDYIVADLPAKGIINSFEHSMLYNEYNIEPTKTRKSFGSFILLILKKLKPNGKAVITVSEGFLVNQGKEKEIRDLLISQDIIESIISLPYGALRPFSDSKASILVLNKFKPHHLINQIQLIKAKAINLDSKSVNLNIEEIIETYKNTGNITRSSQIIEISDIRKGANLSVDSYEPEFMLGSFMRKEGSARLLSDLVEIKSGIQPEKLDIDKDGDIPLVKVENLSKDIIDLNLTSEINYKVHSSYNYSRYIISHECILLARIGDSLKATLYRPSNEIPQILPHGNVYVLIPLSNGQINIEYLYYQLHSSFVLEQIQKRRLGSIMPYLSISALKQVVIPIMDLEAQKSFVESQKANLIAEERLRIEDRIKSLGFKEEIKQTESDIVRTLVHQLRPTLVNIDLEVKNLNRIVEKNKLYKYKEFDNVSSSTIDPEIEHLLSAPQNYTIQDILNKIQQDTLQLNDVLSTVNKVMSFKLTIQDMEEIDLLNFFNEYINSKKIDINGRFTIEVSGIHFNIQINKASFRDLIDQLIINAEKHGFNYIRSGTTHNKIQFKIQLSKDRDVAIIDYQNNGNLNTLSQRDFVSPFIKSQNSTGSGIGGNYIYRIIQAHHGELSIKQGLKNGFGIIFEIPITQNKENE